LQQNRIFVNVKWGKAGGRRQEPEVVRQEAGGRSQKSEVRRLEAGARRQEAGGRR
jgi:hypothetical protein